MGLEPKPDAPESLRLFAAIEFSVELKQTVTQLLVRLQKGAVFSGAHPTWIRAEGVHLTMLFFGWQGPERLPLLKQAMAAGAGEHAPIDLKLGKLVLFPDPKEPKVISLDLAGQLEKLQALHGTLSAHCKRLGFAVETRPFRPHITLARIKSRKGLTGLSALVRSHADMAKGAWTADEITLFQSHLGAGGSTYSVLERFPLVTS